MGMKWELLEKKVLYKRYFRLDEYRLQHQRFDGGMFEVVREVFERGTAVAVLPYDAKRDRLVLIEQFRAGAIDFTDNPWLLELVAGIREPGESEEEVARREAREEAGCEIGELLPVHNYLVSPGASTESCAIFVGSIDSKGLGGVHGLDEEHEDIKVHVFEREAALAMLEEGKINNAITLIGLQWLALHHKELRQRWLSKGA